MKRRKYRLTTRVERSRRAEQVERDDESFILAEVSIPCK